MFTIFKKTSVIGCMIMLMFLSGCSKGPIESSLQRQRHRLGHTHKYHKKVDGRPPINKTLIKSQLKDAVPKLEPKSKSGNPVRYSVLNKSYHVLSSSTGYCKRGLASWYGTKFHGFKTSSGEIYDMYAMTAAHKTLPLPTYAKITNLHNKKSVIVKINDRGPFHGNREIDLSYAAAIKLGMLDKGIGLVEIKALDLSKLSNLQKSRKTNNLYKTSSRLGRVRMVQNSSDRLKKEVYSVSKKNN